MTIQKRFEKFHSNNPLVYYFFKRFTFEVIAKGYQRFSADAIMHRVRWKTKIETLNEKFKINNDYVALYARMFIDDFPQFDGLFEIRRRKTT